MTPGNAGTLDMLNRGEIAIGPVWVDMFYTWQADGRMSPKMKLLAAVAGTAGPADVLRDPGQGGATRRCAKKFIDLAESPEVQAEGIVKQFNWYPGIDPQHVQSKMDQASWNKLFTDISPADLSKYGRPFPLSEYFTDIVEGYERRDMSMRPRVKTRASRRAAMRITSLRDAESRAGTSMPTMSRACEAHLRLLPARAASRGRAADRWPALRCCRRLRSILVFVAPLAMSGGGRFPAQGRRAARSSTSPSRSISTPPTCSSRWRSSSAVDATDRTGRDRHCRLPHARRRIRARWRSCAGSIAGRCSFRSSWPGR